ncbi:hypothetical protein [Dickeya dianthicola]|uniref:hypothetical protein n=1 Tax=Dickeya dianthicola TaxID=204039 RepID=UPI001868F59D|nr:hypothetical protein [Dickeya dianthicola]QOL13698.1 hypothetical protein HGI48_05365 [Dickeya dianthicola]
MDAKKLQKAYVSMLYSDNYRITNAEAEYQYLARTMDSERLIVERAARQRNLRTVLYSDMHFSPRFFSKEQFLALVIAYCESDSFWNWSSRTLIESFCSFVVEQSNLTEEEKTIFLIDGIYSGISTSSENSPWKSNISHVHENSITEEIILDRYFSLSLLNKADHLSAIAFENKTACLRLHNENGKVAISLKETA